MMTAFAETFLTAKLLVVRWSEFFVSYFFLFLSAKIVGRLSAIRIQLIHRQVLTPFSIHVMCTLSPLCPCLIVAGRRGPITTRIYASQFPFSTLWSVHYTGTEHL